MEIALALLVIATPINDRPRGGGLASTAAAHLNDDVEFSLGNTSAAPDAKLLWDTSGTDQLQIWLTDCDGGGTDCVPLYWLTGTSTAVFGGDLDLKGNTITDSLGAAHLCGSGTPGHSAGTGDGYCAGGFEVDGVLYADDDLKFTGTEFMDAVSGDFRIFANNNLLYRQTADNPIAGDGLFDISPATTNDSWTSSSGTQYGFRLRTDLEQSGTAAFHAFEVAVTDDASGSGQDYLLYLDWGADGVPELAVQDTGAKVGSQVKTGLTDAGSNAFVRLSIAQGAHNTAHISYSIHADDGSDLQARSGLLVLAMVNAGGTEACDVQIAAASEAVAVSAGTLTSAFSCASNAADTIDVSVTPTSSLTPTILEIRYSIHLDQDATVTAL